MTFHLSWWYTGFRKLDSMYDIDNQDFNAAQDQIAALHVSYLQDQIAALEAAYLLEYEIDMRRSERDADFAFDDLIFAPTNAALSEAAIFEDYDQYLAMGTSHRANRMLVF